MEVKVEYMKVTPLVTMVEVDDKFRPLATEDMNEFRELPDELFEEFISTLEQKTGMPIGDDDYDHIEDQLKKQHYYEYITVASSLENGCTMAEF